jgi:hypothetical protein
LKELFAAVALCGLLTSPKEPWSAEIPPEAVPYTSARNTQSIFRDITTGVDVRKIQIVLRRELERKWQVPGGMELAAGWESRLYKVVPRSDLKREWKDFISVRNSFGYFQNEVGHVRDYPSGTAFFDVLSNRMSGKVFEVRVREKVDGVWRFRVPYRDEEQWPLGYKKVTTCNSCHKQAGTGGYGVGLVPGGDGTLSDPLSGIE